MEIKLISFNDYKKTMNIFHNFEGEEDYYFACSWNGLTSDFINCVNSFYLEEKYPDDIKKIEYNPLGTEYHQIILIKKHVEGLEKANKRELINEEYAKVIHEDLNQEAFQSWGKEMVLKEYFKGKEFSDEEAYDKFKEVADLDSKIILKQSDLDLF